MKCVPFLARYALDLPIVKSNKVVSEVVEKYSNKQIILVEVLSVVLNLIKWACEAGKLLGTGLSKQDPGLADDRHNRGGRVNSIYFNEIHNMVQRPVLK